MTSNQTSPAWSACIPWLFNARPSFPLHTLATVLLPQLAKSERVCPAGITDQVGCSTSVQPGKLLWGTSPFSFSSCHTGRISGSSASPLTVAIRVAGSSSGSSVGASSSIDASAGASSSVGSSVGAALSIDTSAGAGSLVGSCGGCLGLHWDGCPGSSFQGPLLRCGTHSLIPSHGGGDHHCYCRLHQQYGGCTGLMNIHGGRGLPCRVPPAVKHSAISQNPRGSSFGLAPLPSLSWGASSREPSDKADPEMSSMPYHSSSKRYCTLLCHFELQLWHCLCSPDLEGALPTVAAF